ncbi:hypothetical protein D3C75_991590 [compost metagenome]
MKLRLTCLQIVKSRPRISQARARTKKILATVEAALAEAVPAQVEATPAEAAMALEVAVNLQQRSFQHRAHIHSVLLMEL